MESDVFYSIKAPSQGLYREKGSRFIAFAYPVTDTEEIKEIIDRIRKEHHDARHHCYAYMLGSDRLTWRINDDGEPSGTAGKPILGQINSAGLTDILIVVTRYFGGTLLGVSGLINAYKTAAADAIHNAVIAELTVQEHYELRFPYEAMNSVMKILKDEEVAQSDHLFDMVCSLKISFRASISDRIMARLKRAEGIEIIKMD